VRKGANTAPSTPFEQVSIAKVSDVIKNRFIRYAINQHKLLLGWRNYSSRSRLTINHRDFSLFPFFPNTSCFETFSSVQLKIYGDFG
jgi:hypothetical protein